MSRKACDSGQDIPRRKLLSPGWDVCDVMCVVTKLAPGVLNLTLTCLFCDSLTTESSLTVWLWLLINVWWSIKTETSSSLLQSAWDRTDPSLCQPSELRDSLRVDCHNFVKIKAKALLSNSAGTATVHTGSGFTICLKEFLIGSSCLLFSVSSQSLWDEDSEGILPC